MTTKKNAVKERGKGFCGSLEGMVVDSGDLISLIRVIWEAVKLRKVRRRLSELGGAEPKLRDIPRRRTVRT